MENNTTTILKNIYSGKSSSYRHLGSLLIIIGEATALASVLFLISASKPKRKATFN